MIVLVNNTAVQSHSPGAHLQMGIKIGIGGTPDNLMCIIIFFSFKQYTNRLIY